MRLTQSQISHIQKVLRAHSKKAKVYLHGSRLDDNRKGGDIDLFFVVPKEKYNFLNLIKYKIVSELSLGLNEQKVDLLILSQDVVNKHDFFTNSKKEIL